MTTTVMRDSIVGDAWIQQTAANCPVQRVLNKETGQPNGDILTGPVRLSWVSLLQPAQRQNAKPGQEPKYEASLLFTPYVDRTIFYEEYNRLMAQSFASYFDQQTQQYYGVESPFHDQAMKARLKGYTPGLLYINCKSKFKPPVVDINGNPIVDPARIYAGVWAVCSINAYVYGVNPPQPKKGIAFGIQTVMILGDDSKIGEGGADPRQTFAGIQGQVSAPIVRPDLSRMPQAPQAIPPQGIPGYAAPGGMVMPPMQQPGFVPSAGPQPQGFIPPQPGQFAGAAGMPQQMPQMNVPSATTQSPSDDLSWMK